MKIIEKGKEIEEFLRQKKISFDTDTVNMMFGYDAYIESANPEIVIYPINKKELIEITAYCLKKDMNFLIRAGGTNYVGAVVPKNKEIVISTLRMKKEKEIKIKSNTLAQVPVNISIDEIKNYVSPSYNFPPDPASKNVATIGGAINTNAGGAYCYKYGVTKNYIKSLEVLNKEEIIYFGNENLYSMSSYPLKDLYCGSEGTLLPLLSADLKILPKQKFEEIMIIEFVDYIIASNFVFNLINSDIPLSALDMAISPYFKEDVEKLPITNIVLSVEANNNTIELYRSQIREIVKKNSGKIKNEKDLHKERLNIVQQNVMKVRDKFPEYTYFLFDAVIPRSKLKEMLDFLYEVARHIEFPFMSTYHAGDGNIHPTFYYNSRKELDIKKIKVILYIILTKAIELGGTITGEHGIGVEKIEFQNLILDKKVNNIFKKIKLYFDPKNLMNKEKLISLDKTNLNYQEDLIEYAKEIGDEWIKQCINKKVKLPIYHINKLDGLKDIFSNQCLKDIVEGKYTIPYHPILGLEHPLINLIKLGIPSFYDDFYEIQNYISKIKNKKIELGSNTLKNVSGYNLTGFLLKYSNKIERMCVKFLNREYINSQMKLYRVDKKVYEENSNIGITYAVKNGEEKEYYMVKQPTKKKESEDFKELLKLSEEIIICVMKNELELPKLNNIEKYIIVNRNTLIISHYELEKISMLKNKDILSKRELSLKNGKETILYLDEKLKKQIELESEIKEILNDIL